MRIANNGGRAVVEHEDKWYDVSEATDAKLPSRPLELVERLEDLQSLLRHTDFSRLQPQEVSTFGPPIPDPKQIFAIGLNYRAHAVETGSPIPESPIVFTKFQSSLAGSSDDLTLPSESVDWEVELVVVVGKVAHKVQHEDAMGYVAGYMNGQDVSERVLQYVGGKPQFSLAKSYPGFAPTGPYLVTLDELRDPHDLAMETRLIKGDGQVQVVQSAATSDLIFDVPSLIVELSKIVTLYPGDLIFTGTPSGVGLGMTPHMYLQPGWRLQTGIEGLGSMDNLCVADDGFNDG